MYNTKTFNLFIIFLIVISNSIFKKKPKIYSSKKQFVFRINIPIKIILNMIFELKELFFHVQLSKPS